MTIANFVPEVWSASILGNLYDQLVYGQTGIINRDYEGEIARAGDTVHITSFTDPSTRTYTKNGTITWDLLADSGQTLVVDQSDYFAFKVDNIDTRQALPGFVEKCTTGASYNLAVDADTYLATAMLAAVTGDNALGATTIASDTPSQAYDLMVDIRTRLVRSKVPATGRWVIVPPELYAVLLHDDRFIRVDASGSTEGLRNGQVGRIAGLDVIESNTVPTSGAAYKVLAGHAMGTTFAEQIASVKAVDLQDTFGDGVKGLHLYGAKVVRPSMLVSALVTIDDGDSSSSS